MPTMNNSQREAIAEADAHTDNAGLPTYSDLVALLRRAAGLGDLRPALAKEADAILDQLPA